MFHRFIFTDYFQSYINMKLSFKQKIARTTDLASRQKWEHAVREPEKTTSDVSKDGEKAIGLDWKINSFSRASRFSVHFYAVTARLRRKNV